MAKLISLDLARQLFGNICLVEQAEGMTFYRYILTDHSFWVPVFEGKKFIGYEGSMRYDRQR